MTIWFYSKSPDHAWLSNFSDHGFTIEGVRWPSVEHFYQASKYAGTDVAERVRKAESALKARKIGQDRSLEPRADWSEVKADLMRLAIRAKFEQNRRLRESLLATGDEELIHESGSDPFWGRSRDGIGENRLGEILMSVREELRSSA